MSTLILGVGLGTFILISIWLTAFVLCFVSVRTQSNVGPVFIALSSVFMLVLFAIPRGTTGEVTTLQKVYDSLFIWRITLTILLGLSALGGFLFYFRDHIMEEKHAKFARR